MNFSERIDNVQESQTLKFTNIIGSIRKKGQSVIDFAVGEPLFDTPEEVIDATKQALDDRKTRYSSVSGLVELKESIANNLKNLSYDKDNITITNGSKQALYSIFQALCNPGDEVIVPSPFWVSFPEQIKLAGAKPVSVDTVEHQLDLDKIKKAISKKTKAIVVNSPNNPTGAVYPKNKLKELVDIASEKNIFIISDEAYDWLVYDGIKPQTLASLFSGEAKNIITVKSFSKTFAMTGFRIGYVAAEKEVISKLNKLQSHLAGNVCTFAQYGALAATKIDEKVIERNVKELEKKRNLAYGLVSKQFDCVKPQGAFYLFPNIEKKFNGKIKNSVDLAEFILKKAGVAVVPGSAFGSDSKIRISYAVSNEELKEGFEKIAEAL
jgi:aspartate aminotransferase